MWFVGLFNLFFFHEPNLDEYIWYNNNTEKKRLKWVNIKCGRRDKLNDSFVSSSWQLSFAYEM